MKSKIVIVSCAVVLAGMTPSLWAAANAAIHAAAYSEGFLVETERQVTVTDVARRTSMKTIAKGTAEGDVEAPRILIERLDQGFQLILDPKAKTYTKSAFMNSNLDNDRENQSSMAPPTLKITRIEPKVTGPLGTADINGFPCQSYTIRVEVDFSDARTMTVTATETLLEKLWVTEKAPAVQAFQKAQTNFDEALYAKFGAEELNLRWLIREFNKQLLELQGDPKDFEKIRNAYRAARASIQGVTVRQLAAWRWNPKDNLVPATDSHMADFIASLAAGLGAPPDTEGKTPLSPKDRPRWVVDMEADLGRTGPTAMLMTEVRKASTVKAGPDAFTAPEDYRLQKN